MQATIRLCAQASSRAAMGHPAASKQRVRSGDGGCSGRLQATTRQRLSAGLSGSDDDHEPDYRNQGRRKPAPASEHGRQPIENRIERDGQHDAPDDDRYERTYENEGPVGEKADKSEVNRQFDESRVELTIIERFYALFGH
jgi:hypothetical protein